MDMEKKKEYIKKQQQWLLFLRHCAKCDKPVGQCQYGQNCVTAKNLWNHITQVRAWAAACGGTPSRCQPSSRGAIRTTHAPRGASASAPSRSQAPLRLGWASRCPRVGWMRVSRG